jgi:hypothetical protein
MKGAGFKPILYDSHFWVPLAVFVAGLILLVALH